MVSKILSTPTPWIQIWRPRPQARLRLFCFPFAGGGATIFRAFAERLPSEVEVCAVQLPGREGRFSEAAFTRVDRLVPRLVEVLADHLTMPYAFFGHSMGALISFELAHALHERQQLPESFKLIVSAHRAPHLPSPYPPIHQLPAPQFLAKLRHFNGTPEAFMQNDELLQTFLPLLRADFELCETYAYTNRTPLDNPIYAMGGRADRDVPCESILAWREQTKSTCSTEFFEGNHFFIQQQQSEVLSRLAQILIQDSSTLKNTSQDG